MDVNVWFRYGGWIDYGSWTVQYMDGELHRVRSKGRMITFDDLMRKARNIIKLPVEQLLWLDSRGEMIELTRELWDGLDIPTIGGSDITIIIVGPYRSGFCILGNRGPVGEDDGEETEVSYRPEEPEVSHGHYWTAGDDLAYDFRGLGLRGGNPDDGESNNNETERQGYTAPVEGQCSYEGVDDDDNYYEIPVTAGDPPGYDETEDEEELEEVAKNPAELEAYEVAWASGEGEADLRSTDLATHASSSSEQTAIDVATTYDNKEDVQAAVTTWHLQNYRRCLIAKSNKTVLSYHCADPNCTWSLRATSSGWGGCWRIVKVGPSHSCQSTTPASIRKQLNCMMIARLIYPYVKGAPKTKIKTLQTLVQDTFHQKPSYRKTWYAKHKVLDDIYGTAEDAFKNLPRLTLGIQQANPGTRFEYDFKRIDGRGGATFGMWWWAFEPSILGFPHCRPVVCIDGTHLYGKYKGTVLVAVTYDADEGIFPLAFQLCAKENNDTWSFFLRHLRQHVTKDREICLISDRHGAIISSVQEIYPEPLAVHRFCARHIASNFNHKFPEYNLKDHFIEMIWTGNKRKCMRMYNALYNGYNGVFRAWLDSCGDLSRWTLSHDGGFRYGIMTSNQAESFNAVLKDARSLPVTAIVKETFYRMNGWWAKRKAKGDTLADAGHVFMPEFTKILHKVQDEGSLFTAVTYIAGELFSVEMRNGITKRVDLRAKTCECGLWELFHRPCKHAMCAIQEVNGRATPYVDRKFLIHAYCRSYGYPFKPLFGEDNWPEWEGPSISADPDLLITTKGRRKTRIPNEMDTSKPRKTKKCSNCGQQGHNKRKCINQNANVSANVSDNE